MLTAGMGSRASSVALTPQHAMHCMACNEMQVCMQAGRTSLHGQPLPDERSSMRPPAFHQSRSLIRHSRPGEECCC